MAYDKKEENKAGERKFYSVASLVPDAELKQFSGKMVIPLRDGKTLTLNQAYAIQVGAASSYDGNMEVYILRKRELDAVKAEFAKLFRDKVIPPREELDKHYLAIATAEKDYAKLFADGKKPAKEVIEQYNGAIARARGEFAPLFKNGIAPGDDVLNRHELALSSAQSAFDNIAKPLEKNLADTLARFNVMSEAKPLSPDGSPPRVPYGVDKPVAEIKR